MGPIDTRPANVMPMVDGRLLIVPGLHGSGPGHWQLHWKRLYSGCEWVEQDHWDEPDLVVWSQRLRRYLPRDGQPVLLVAHSFGCLTTAHCVAAAGGVTIAGALLVAPVDPHKFDVAELVRTVLPFPSLVVGSDNDPWMTTAHAQQWAKVWGSAFINIGAVGHINAESGLGDWPDGQQLLQTLMEQVQVTIRQ